MAYRRRQQIGRIDGSFTYNYDSVSPREAATASPDTYSSSSSASSLAAKAIRASSVYRDSSISSLYEQSALSSPRGSTPSSAKDSYMDEHPKKKDLESKHGFWGVLARKAKAILDDDDHNTANVLQTPGGPTLQRVDRSKTGQCDTTYVTPESRRKNDSPALQKGFDAITSSLNYIGNALEEGITAVENRTSDIIQETRKIQIRKKTGISRPHDQGSYLGDSRQPQMSIHGKPQTHADFDTQLKASRDVAMAMAAKAKLLLRELKTVKADLAFAKERCAQLEEENRILRENREKGDIPEDDDLIRLQLESLLAEKARLAQENSVYARENRFLREIVEYHQLTMQDVVYLDEGSEEVTEVYPSRMPAPAEMQSLVAMPAVSPSPTIPQGAISPAPPNLSLDFLPSLEVSEVSQTVNAVNPYVKSSADGTRKH